MADGIVSGGSWAPAAVSAVISWGACFGDEDYVLDSPSGWDVSQCDYCDGPDIGDAGVLDALAHPIGSGRLRELARGKRRPWVVIDDLSRPTLGSRLIPPILDELEAAHIPSEDTLLLVGVSNHRSLTRVDLE